MIMLQLYMQKGSLDFTEHTITSTRLADVSLSVADSTYVAVRLSAPSNSRISSIDEDEVIVASDDDVLAVHLSFIRFGILSSVGTPDLYRKFQWTRR
jgi:hypothetical protein